MLNLITDRTTADIGLTDKGSYNASDLNRVADACAYLYNLIVSAGYTVSGYELLQNDYMDEDIPTQGVLQTYLSTVSALKAVFNADQELPSTARRLTVDGANNIEKLLLEVEEQLHQLSAAFVRSGSWNAVAGMTIYAAN